MRIVTKTFLLSLLAAVLMTAWVPDLSAGEDGDAPDSGTPDSGTLDAGTQDTGTQDAGASDASDQLSVSLQPGVILFGNAVIASSIIWWRTGLNNFSQPDETGIKSAVEKIYSLYRESGYTLVDVGYRKTDNTWFIMIDEGRIDQIILTGAASYLNTMQLRYEIYLPFLVFNKDLVEASLENSRAKYHLKNITYKVEKVVAEKKATKVNEVLQLPDWVMFVNETPPELATKERTHYNLVINIEAEKWGSGLGYDFSYISEGLTGTVSYTDKSLIAKNDREKVSATLGFQLRTSLNPGGSTYFSYATGDIFLAWFTPPLVGNWLSLNLSSDSYVPCNQRQDMSLERYFLYRQNLILGAEFKVTPKFTITPGFGIQFDNIFGVEYVEGSPHPYVPQLPFHRWGTGAKFDVYFDEPTFRNDQRHHLEVFTMGFFGSDQYNFAKIEIKYQKYFHYGYDTIELKAALVTLLGNPIFSDEYPVTWGPLHAGFGSNYYLIRGVWFEADYGLSLYKDIIQAHFFVDLVEFGYIKHQKYSEVGVFAFAAGPGITMLLWNAFLINVYYSLGYAVQTGYLDSEMNFGLSKVF